MITNKTKLTIAVIAVLILAAIFSLKSPRKETLPQPSVKPAVISEAEPVKKTENSEINTKVLNPTTNNSIAKSQKDGIVIEGENLEALIEPGFYAKPWRRRLEEYDKLVNVPIRQIAEPDNYTLKFNPKPDRSYRYIDIASSWLGAQEEPILRMVNESIIATKLNNEGELLIDQEQKRIWSLSARAEMAEQSPIAGFKRQFLVRGSDLHLIQQNDSGPQVEKEPVKALEVERFVFDLPKDSALQVGKSWVVNGVEPSPFTIINTLAGFADVDGVITAKFISEREVSIGDSFKKAVKVSNVDNLPSSMRFKTVTYVELDTGLVVRTEIETTVEAGTIRSKSIEISQRIPCDK